jgi:hypothetical protein
MADQLGEATAANDSKSLAQSQTRRLIEAQVEMRVADLLVVLTEDTRAERMLVEIFETFTLPALDQIAEATEARP